MISLWFRYEKWDSRKKNHKSKKRKYLSIAFQAKTRDNAWLPKKGRTVHGKNHN